MEPPPSRLRDSDRDGSLNETLYDCTDANMNVTALVSTNGQVVERCVYDPYGRVAFLDSVWQPAEVTGHEDGTASVYANEVLYCGYRYDPETGWTTCATVTTTSVCRSG